MRFTHCRVRVAVEQAKRCLDIITINNSGVGYLLWCTKKNKKHPQINTKHLHLSRNPCLLPSFPLRSVWCTSQSEAYECMLFCFFCFFFPFPYVYVWPCGCTAIIITLVNTHMSTYWSRYQWAVRYLRLQRASWICLEFYWDHTARSAWVQLKITPPGKIIGSYVALLAALNACLITVYKRKLSTILCGPNIYFFTCKASFLKKYVFFFHLGVIVRKTCKPLYF